MPPYTIGCEVQTHQNRSPRGGGGEIKILHSFGPALIRSCQTVCWGNFFTQKREIINSVELAHPSLRPPPKKQQQQQQQQPAKDDLSNPSTHRGEWQIIQWYVKLQNVLGTYRNGATQSVEKFWWGNSWGTSTGTSRETGCRKGKSKWPRCPTSGVGYRLGWTFSSSAIQQGVQKSGVPGRQRYYILYGGPTYLWVLVVTCFMPSYWQLEFLRWFLRYSKICRTYYRGANKSLARPGRKQATATKL